MESRRDFIKKASLIAGSMMMPEAISKAMAINPADGSTVWDADHVVILMQENRSFDHSYGALRGVRGFNDPRAVELPNGNKVWFQSDPQGRTFVPFRLNIKDTKATWMRGLPHSWENQVEARNHGKYDQWLLAKPSGNREYKDIPLTLGYFDREDIPFYYAFADAFTVCDQNFSSSLTGTTANRNYLWTGTIRENNDYNNKACVQNSDVTYDSPAFWKTFPERLEEAGIDWRVYQNELSLPVGFEGEEESWLANFTDNNLEWFDVYKVRFHPEYQSYLKRMLPLLPGQIEEACKKADETGEKEHIRSLKRLEDYYKIVQHDLKEYTAENFERLSEVHKSIHKRAFTTNRNHEEYHETVEIEFAPGQNMVVPKGDVLYQFRKDVNEGKLPQISWLVAPQNFSDHPSAPWYGAWYVSEVLEILTKNPEVWKKTVFILCYDENDGYYDHVPPFVPPHPQMPETGKVSSDMDLWAEQVNIKHENARSYVGEVDGPIGLGYRVPLVIASPWSRGGKVCSEVFDHTSILMFLEKFLKKRYNTEVKEENITEWRRTICGDLSSAFMPYKDGVFEEFVEKESFLKSIRLAKDKAIPSNYIELTPEEAQKANDIYETLPWRAKQETGIKKSPAIPYELYADAHLNDLGSLGLNLKVSDQFNAKGAPFFANARNAKGEFQSRHYTLKAGESLSDNFEKHQGIYDVRVHGPNGFYRKFKGNKIPVEVNLTYTQNRRGVPLGDIEIMIKNISNSDLEIELQDLSYGTGSKKVKIKKGKSKTLMADLKKSYNWYDMGLTVKNYPDFDWRFAGRVETGKEGYTDPNMGRVL